MRDAVTQTVSLLSDKAEQFSWAQVMSTAAKLLPSAADTLPLLRAEINVAISEGRLIPMDNEKGVFTSHIHLLDELSVRQLAADSLATGKVLTNGEPAQDVRGVYATLADDRAALVIVGGKGGAAVQGERISQLAALSERQGRSAVVVAPTARFRQFLQNDSGLTVPVTGRDALRDDMSLTAYTTVIVPQAETLGVKDTLFLTEQASAAGAQVIFMDSGTGKGTGHGLGVLESAGVTRHRFNDYARPSVQVVTERDKNARYQAIAVAGLDSMAQGHDTRLQVSGEKEQQLLTAAVRDEMRQRGLLTGEAVRIQTLTPVWLSRHDRASRDTYREGMVMERFDAPSKTMMRYTIDRVSDTRNTLRLVDGDGRRETLALKDVGEQWSLYRTGEAEVATGDALRVLGREARGRLRGGDRVTVAGVDEKGRLRVESTDREGEKKTVALDVSQPLKVIHGYVESPGASVQADARVFAALTTREMREETVNRLAVSGSHITLWSALDAERAGERLAKMTGVRMVSDQVKAVTGRTDTGEASVAARDQTMTDAQRAVHIALNDVQNHKVAFQMAEILSAAVKINPQVSPAALLSEINRQAERGELIRVEGRGGLMVPREMYEMEKSILRTIAEGKNAVAPLMEKTPDAVLAGLTAGQQSATRMILESRDRFTGVQGYAGVGKTTQFRAVVQAISLLPEGQRPEITGLAPTHRAVGEMQENGVRAQTLDSFLFEHQTQVQNGETPDYSHRLVLLDEASMAGNRKLSEAYQVLAKGGARVITSGDDAQLKAIETGQPFRLAQQRSAMDVAIMKEIVRQKPELREAVYDMIAGNVRGSLDKTARTLPDYVPRHGDAWMPERSVMQIAPRDREAVQALVAAGQPASLTDAIARDFAGRTADARDSTLVVAHLNRDRQAINRGIHDQLVTRGAVTDAQTVSVLTPVRVTESQARTLTAWQENTGNMVMMDRDYWTITGTDTQAGVAMLRNADGKERLISPFDNSTQKPQFYRSQDLDIGVGDRLRFTRSDNERGYVNNARMTVESVDGHHVVLSTPDGSRKQMDLSRPEDRHLDLGYAVTAYGAQGASERFVITLEGVEGARKAMASPDAAYVALSRHKEHVQVYTDNLEGWMAAVESAKETLTAHDVLHEKDDRQAMRAQAILAMSRPADSVALGRNMLSGMSLDGATTSGRFVPGTRRYPEPSLAFPAWNAHGHQTGVMQLPSDEQGQGYGRPEIVGAEDARFVAIQQSSNGTVMLADSLPEAVRLAGNHPATGVILRFSGDGQPHNIGRLTGGDTVVPSVPDILSHPAVTGRPDPEQVAEAMQRHDEVKQPDVVVPVDALPALVRKVEELLPDRLADEKADAAQIDRALDTWREKEKGADKTPDVPAPEPKLTTQLRNVEREIIKSFED